METHKNDKPPLLRILLVEDNEHDRAAFRRAINKAPMPYEIQTCVRAEEALENLSDAASSFDILVTDFLLPGMNGLDLCKELIDKKVPIPLVILTGSGSEHIAVEALKAGVHDYIVKDPEQGYLKLLPFVIRDVVHKHKDRQKREQAEEALRQNVERSQTVLNVAMDGFWIVDTQGHLLEANESYCQMSGYNTQELLAMCISDLEAIEAATGTSDHIQKVMEQGEDRFETKHRRKDGTIFDVEASVQYIPIEGGRLVVFLRDITERKRAEYELRESENSVRKKLQAILEPEGDLGVLNLGDVVDYQALQSMMEEFYKITKVGSAVLDISGKVLVAVGWQDVCTKFHRCHPDTLKNCIESDTALSSGVPAGTFKAYRCKNNLWDMVTPIEMGGRHLGNIFLGQFFFEDEVPDYDLFRFQAHQYGFDEAAYLAAVDRVPFWSRETVEAVMAFYAKLAGMIASLSYSTIRLSRSLSQQEAALRKLGESEEDLKKSQRIAHVGSWRLDVVRNQVVWSDELYKMYGFDPTLPPPPYTEHQKLFTRESWDRLSTALDHTRDTGIPYELELETVRKDGSHGWMWVHGETVLDESGLTVGLRGAAQDITDRKQAEARLLKSKATLRAMLNASPLAIVLVDRTGRVLDSNEEHANRLKMTRDQIIGKCLWDLLPECVLARRRKQVESVFETATRFTGEDKREAIWNEYYIHPAIKNKKGEIEAVIIEALDITDRKQAEEALKESKLFLDNMSDVAYRADDHGNLVWVNPAIERITGHSREDLIGKPFLPLFIVTDHASLIDVYKRTLMGESLENTLTFTSGVTCHFTSLPYSNKNGDIVGTFGVARDITAQLDAQRALQTSEERLKKAQETAKIGNWEYDVSTGRVWGSEEAFRIYGIEQTNEYLPLDEVESHIVEAKRVNQALVDLVTKGEKYNIEFQITQKNNQGLITIHSIAELVKDEEGNPIKVLGVIQDITDKKAKEEENTRLLGQLQNAQKMESIGNLAGGIAHDFNNILFPIVGMSEMLLEDFPPGSPEHQSVREIFKAGMRGSDLVKQILAFSRQTEHKMIPVRVQQILKEVVKLTRSAIPSDIRVSQYIQSDCGLVIADPTQLHQIAMNLITNAYHAVEQTGGKISVSLKETVLGSDDLPTSSLEPGNYAMISIADTGCGIDSGDMDKIFEPYFTTKEQGKGTGLGLALVYGIVKEHGGDIRVYSEAGKGTTFNVYLPLVVQNVDQASSKTVEIQPTGTERILLVDDEEPIVQIEKQMLERLGYKVAMRVNSLEALEAFKANPDAYDLILTDMTMPNMTGDQLARKLIAIRPNIPIIICTGFSERLNQEKVAAIGVKGFLMKPVVKAEMAKMVRTVLDEAKGTAQ